MLRNINNFFNIIKAKRLKKTLVDNDMIAIGTRDAINRSDYQDTAISFADLQAQVATAGTQGPPGSTGATGAQGVPGIQGTAGTPGAVGLTFVGEWNAGNPGPSTVAYSIDEVVFYNGSSFVAVNNILIGEPFPTDADPNWNFLALQGLQGPQGVPGSGFSISDASRVVSVPTPFPGSQFAFRELLIPANSFAVGDVFNVVAGFIAVEGTTGSFTYETYINTVSGLGGATSLFDITMTASRRYMNTIQTFYIDGVGPTLGPTGNLNTVTSGFTQYNNSGTNLSIDWTVDQYFIIAGRNASDRDVINVGAKIY